MSRPRHSATTLAHALLILLGVYEELRQQLRREGGEQLGVRRAEHLLERVERQVVVVGRLHRLDEVGHEDLEVARSDRARAKEEAERTSSSLEEKPAVIAGRRAESERSMRLPISPRQSSASTESEAERPPESGEEGGDHPATVSAGAARSTRRPPATVERAWLESVDEAEGGASSESNMVVMASVWSARRTRPGARRRRAGSEGNALQHRR